MSTLQWLLGAYDTKGRTPLSDASLRTGLSALPEPDVALSPMLATLVSVLRQAPYLLLSLHSTNTQTGRQGWGKKRGKTTGNQADWKQEGVQSPGSPGCSRTAWEREEVRLRESQPAPPSSSARSQKLSLAEGRNWAASRSPRVRESQRAVRLLIHTQEGWTDTHTKIQSQGGYCVHGSLFLLPPSLWFLVTLLVLRAQLRDLLRQPLPPTPRACVLDPPPSSCPQGVQPLPPHSTWPMLLDVSDSLCHSTDNALGEFPP